MKSNQYNKCVELYSDGLYRYMIKTCGNATEAKDLVQDAFEKLWIHRGKLVMEQAKSFLFKTAYRKNIDEYRKKQSKLGYETAMKNNDQTYNIDLGLKDILEKALAQLSEQYKKLILLRDYEGYSYAEIAKISGLSLSQVKVYIFRARKEMKAICLSLEKV